MTLRAFMLDRSIPTSRHTCIRSASFHGPSPCFSWTPFSYFTTFVPTQPLPLLFFSRVKLQSDRRVLRDLFQPGATQLCFSTLNSTFVLVKNQGLERFCLKTSPLCTPALSERLAACASPTVISALMRPARINPTTHPSI